MNRILGLVIIAMLTLGVCANEIQPPMQPHKPTLKERKEFDKMLDERLQLTNEQKNQIKENRAKHKKEMERTINKMENLHKKIKNVYILGIPKYQADLRTATYKTELAILAQQAQKQKLEHRKEFENILTKEQRVEFEKMKKERALKRQQQKQLN